VLEEKVFQQLLNQIEIQHRDYQTIVLQRMEVFRARVITILQILVPTKLQEI